MQSCSDNAVTDGNSEANQAGGVGAAAPNVAGRMSGKANAAGDGGARRKNGRSEMEDMPKMLSSFICRYIF